MSERRRHPNAATALICSCGVLVVSMLVFLVAVLTVTLPLRWCPIGTVEFPFNELCFPNCSPGSCVVERSFVEVDDDAFRQSWMWLLGAFASLCMSATFKTHSAAVFIMSGGTGIFGFVAFYTMMSAVSYRKCHEGATYLSPNMCVSKCAEGCAPVPLIWESKQPDAFFYSASMAFCASLVLSAALCSAGAGAVEAVPPPAPAGNKQPLLGVEPEQKI